MSSFTFRADVVSSTVPGAVSRTWKLTLPGLSTTDPEADKSSGAYSGDFTTRIISGV